MGRGSSWHGEHDDQDKGAYCCKAQRVEHGSLTASPLCTLNFPGAVPDSDVVSEESCHTWWTNGLTSRGEDVLMLTC